MTFDPYFDPLSGKLSLGNTPSRIQHIEIIQKKYVNCFSPKMPHTFTFPKICTSLIGLTDDGLWRSLIFYSLYSIHVVYYTLILILYNGLTAFA